MPAWAGPITSVKGSPFRGRTALPIWGHELWGSLISFAELLLQRGRLRLRSSVRLDALADGPDKAREFARERHYDLVVMEMAGAQAPVFGRQAQLRPPRDVTGGFW